MFRPQIGEKRKIKYGLTVAGIDSAIYFILMSVSLIAASDCLANNSEIQKMIYRYVTDADYVEVDMGENK